MIHNTFCGNNLLFIIMYLGEINAVRAENKQEQKAATILYHYTLLLLSIISDHRQRLRARYRTCKLVTVDKKWAKFNGRQICFVAINNNQASFWTHTHVNLSLNIFPRFHNYLIYSLIYYMIFLNIHVTRSQYLWITRNRIILVAVQCELALTFKEKI